MFVHIAVISAISLFFSQAGVMASFDPTTSNSTSCCEGGTSRCCQVDSSEVGGVNDEKCQSYSEGCTSQSDYVPSCCYITVTDYYFCNDASSSMPCPQYRVLKMPQSARNEV